MMTKRYFSMIAFVLLALTVQAQNERKMIRQGADDYKNKRYAESEAQFKKALLKNKNSYEAQFNIADALYKQEKFEEALNAFQTLAAKETDKQHLAALNHNIGNCQLSMYNKAQQQAQQGQQGQQGTPPTSGDADIDKAIESYKKSLKNNPADNETRYNYIAAEKMKDDKKKDKNKDQKQDKPQDQKQDQKQQQQQQQQDVSKQDAQRILEAMQQEEKNLQDKKRKVKASGRQSDKNW